MTSTPSYQHKPLEHKDSIRVLLLLPSTNRQDPIQIELAPCRLSEVESPTDLEADAGAKHDSEPTPKHQDGFKYEALSYAWGDPTDTAPIYVGEGMTASLPVTRNCLNALRALRQKDLPRRLWIDAICINQIDLAERSSQVRMMARIFAAGSRTAIYLGEHTSSSRVLFEFAADQLRLGITYSEMIDWNELPRPELLPALEDLIERPWFRRVWVVQEVYVNKNRLVLCGESTIPYMMLSFLLHCCLPNWEFTRRLPFTWAPDVKLDPKSKIYIRDRLWISLIASRELLASDSRDKIFAMKALIGKQHVELDPLIDYSKTPEQVFTSLAKIFLHRFGLKILGMVRHGHDLNMPSWVPDWSQNTPWGNGLKCNFEHGSILYFDEDVESEVESTHSMGQRKKLSLSEANMLSVLGWPLGQIIEIGAAFQFRDLHDAKQQLFSVACLLGEDWVQGTTEKLDLITARKHFPRKIFQALTAFRNACAFFSRWSGSGTSFTYMAKHQNPGTNISGMMQSLQKCRVFLSDDGYMGIAPQIAEGGDVLVRLETEPFRLIYVILRPVQDGHWRLISGDCHAERIDGEILYDIPGDPREFVLS